MLETLENYHYPARLVDIQVHLRITGQPSEQTPPWLLPGGSETPVVWRVLPHAAGRCQGDRRPPHHQEPCSYHREQALTSPAAWWRSPVADANNPRLCDRTEEPGAAMRPHCAMHRRRVRRSCGLQCHHVIALVYSAMMYSDMAYSVMMCSA